MRKTQGLSKVQEVEVLYHHFYPHSNRGGSGSFYSVTVWQTVLELPEIDGWNVPVRILEARMVIRNNIKYHVYEVSGVDTSWDYIMKYAENLTTHWLPLFRDAEILENRL